jgi:hypothetical protein
MGTVALAVPLAAQVPRLRRSFAPLVCALVCGCVTAIASAIGVAALLGATGELERSMGPESATTPIAMAVSQQLGGIPSLTAVLVIATGIIGAVGARFLFNAMKIESHAICKLSGIAGRRHLASELEVIRFQNCILCPNRKFYTGWTQCRLPRGAVTWVTFSKIRSA